MRGRGGGEMRKKTREERWRKGERGGEQVMVESESFIYKSTNRTYVTLFYEVLQLRRIVYHHPHKKYSNRTAN